MEKRREKKRGETEGRGRGKEGERFEEPP